MAALSFSKVLFRFSVAFYLLQFYGLKDFTTVVVYIIAIALEQLEVYVFSFYYWFPMSLEIG